METGIPVTRGGFFGQVAVKLRPSCQQEDGKWASTLRGEELVTEAPFVKVDLLTTDLDYQKLWPNSQVENVTMNWKRYEG